MIWTWRATKACKEITLDSSSINKHSCKVHKSSLLVKYKWSLSYIQSIFSFLFPGITEKKMVTGQTKSKGLFITRKTLMPNNCWWRILETPTDVRLPFLINFKDLRFAFVRDACVMHQKSRKVKKTTLSRCFAMSRQQFCIN